MTTCLRRTSVSGKHGAMGPLPRLLKHQDNRYKGTVSLRQSSSIAEQHSAQNANHPLCGAGLDFYDFASHVPKRDFFCYEFYSDFFSAGRKFRSIFIITERKTINRNAPNAIPAILRLSIPSIFFCWDSCNFLMCSRF